MYLNNVDILEVYYRCLFFILSYFVVLGLLEIIIG